MANYFELPVYKKSYDLLVGIFQLTHNFSKEYKYTVGESLKKETIELIIGIYKVNRSRDKSELIQITREHIEVVRLLIRLMKDMKQKSLKNFVRINDLVEHVSKQLSGWQKSQT